MLDLGISIFNAEMFAALLGGGGVVDPVPDFLFHYHMDGTDTSLTHQGTPDYRIGPECTEAIGTWLDNAVGDWLNADPDTALAAVGDGPWSMAFWVNINQDANNLTVISNGDGTSANAGSWHFALRDTGVMRFRHNSINRDTSIPINDGLWHHYVLTSVGNAGEIRIYMDGLLDTVTTQAAAGLGNEGFLRVGARTVGGTNRWIGGLDGIRMYDRVLTPAEVTTLSTYRCDFSPSQITTDAWYDAFDRSTITEAAGLMSQWDDKSGNLNHALQAVGANQPTVNGRSILYDGVDRFLSMTNRLFAVQTVFIAHKWTNTAGDSRVIIADSGSTNYHGDTEAAGGLFSAAFGAQIVIDGDNYVDGTLTAGALARYTSDTVLTLQPDGNTTVGQLGRDRGFSTRTFVGDMYEIILIEGVLSTEDRQKVEGYLAWRHGTVASLPPTHPYKNTTPKE